MILKLCWKNIWRKKTRSLIVIGAVTLGTTAGVFVAGLLIGWTNQRVKAAIYTEASHLKIRHPHYANNEDISLTLPHIGPLKTMLDTVTALEAYSCRTIIVAMVNTARGTTGLKLNGIDPVTEKKVCNVYQHLLTGQYLTDSMANGIVISDKTAELLKIKQYKLTPGAFDSLGRTISDTAFLNGIKPLVNQTYYTKKQFIKAFGSVISMEQQAKYGPYLTRLAIRYRLNTRLVVSFTAMDSTLVYQTYRVAGIYKTSNTMFDQQNAFVLREPLNKLAGLPTEAGHELTLLFHNQLSHQQLTQWQATQQSQWPQLSFINWKQLVPDAAMVADFIAMYYYIIMGIIFFALAFGIINTMLMAILERTHELGMLMAIGMSRRQVYTMITLETLLLTAVGSLTGMALGALVVSITAKTGLNFESVAEGFEAMGWSARVYPDINATFFFGISVMVVTIALLAGIIPARKAMRIKPIEAVRAN